MFSKLTSFRTVIHINNVILYEKLTKRRPMDSTALKVALGCIAIRLAVNSLFPSLQQQLDQSVEFSTPVTSFRSLQEGIYLLRNNIQVYNHGVVHHPPILIFFLSLFNSDRLISLIYALIDGLIAY